MRFNDFFADRDTTPNTEINESQKTTNKDIENKMRKTLKKHGLTTDISVQKVTEDSVQVWFDIGSVFFETLNYPSARKQMIKNIKKQSTLDAAELEETISDGEEMTVDASATIIYRPYKTPGGAAQDILEWDGDMDEENEVPDEWFDMLYESINLMTSLFYIDKPAGTIKVKGVKLK